MTTSKTLPASHYPDTTIDLSDLGRVDSPSGSATNNGANGAQRCDLG